jgi:protein TonB
MMQRHATTGGSVSTRSGSHPHHPRPDATRILGISGTLAFNLVMLLVLLAPLSRPDSPRLPDPPMVFDWITPKAVPPDPPPIEVEVAAPQARTTPEVRPRPVPPAVEPVMVDNGSLPAQSIVERPATDLSPAATTPATSTAPLAGARLAYLEAPAPRYPREALVAGSEGTVLLQVLVGVDGRPLEVRVHQGSGYRVLDDAARRQVLRHWRFQPAMLDGRAVQATGLVPIEFKLGR